MTTNEPTPVDLDAAYWEGRDRIIESGVHDPSTCDPSVCEYCLGWAE